jgi:hypothetical protein
MSDRFAERLRWLTLRRLLRCARSPSALPFGGGRFNGLEHRGIGRCCFQGLGLRPKARGSHARRNEHKHDYHWPPLHRHVTNLTRKGLGINPPKLLPNVVIYGRTCHPSRRVGHYASRETRGG